MYCCLCDVEEEGVNNPNQLLNFVNEFSIVCCINVDVVDVAADNDR